MRRREENEHSAVAEVTGNVMYSLISLSISGSIHSVCCTILPIAEIPVVRTHFDYGLESREDPGYRQSGKWHNRLYTLRCMQ